jgi:hypothetical protein
MWCCKNLLLVRLPWFLTEGSTSLLATSSSPLRGATTRNNHHHHRIRKYFWHRCRGSSSQHHHFKIASRQLASISGAVAGEASSTSTRFPITNHISLHLHYLPFASHFPLPHFTNLPLIFISPTSPICRFIRFSFLFTIFLARYVFVCTLVLRGHHVSREHLIM